MKCLNILIWIVIIAAICLIGLATFWLSYPYSIPDFKNFESSKQIYYPGETLTYNITYSKSSDSFGIVYRSIKDKVIYQIDTFQGNLPIGDNLTISDSVILPNYIKPDTYKIRLVAVIKVNPIRNITKEYLSLPFTIN